MTLAIENSHFEMIHALLAVPDIAVSPDQVHRLCTLAAQEGDLHLLRLMLHTPGTDVNKRVDYSSPYLVLAAKNGHLPIVNALLAVPGIDVNAWGREIKIQPKADRLRRPLISIVRSHEHACSHSLKNLSNSLTMAST